MTSSKTFTILTEEVPGKQEIDFILWNVLQIEPSEYEILPVYLGEVETSEENFKKFTNEWIVSLPDIIVIVKLFKGKTSCVDYLLFDGVVDNDTCAGNAIAILESTKTTDTSSRNTAVFQRITKFMVYKKMFPDSLARCIMFYTDEWKNKSLTKTALFGLRLMMSLGIELFHGTTINLSNTYSITPFIDIAEMIETKNSIMEKRGNVSVRITSFDGIYTINCKLDKGTTSCVGKISHDPNVGLLSGIVNFIYNMDNVSIIKVTNHNLSQRYFDKMPESKFWYAIDNIPVLFDEVNIIERPILPSLYFVLETMITEKVSTILFSQVINKSYNCIFSNHSGCALTNVKTKDGRYEHIERTMKRPDILFYNETDNELIIVEGKLEKELKNGLKQLQDIHLERFTTMIQSLYPGATIKKGLCITINSIHELGKYADLEYPILFAIDNDGKFMVNI